MYIRIFTSIPIYRQPTPAEAPVCFACEGLACCERRVASWERIIELKRDHIDAGTCITLAFIGEKTRRIYFLYLQSATSFTVYTFVVSKLLPSFSNTFSSIPPKKKFLLTLFRDAGVGTTILDKDAAVDETLVQTALLVTRVDDVAGSGGLLEHADLVLAFAGVVVVDGVGCLGEFLVAFRVPYLEGAFNSCQFYRLMISSNGSIHLVGKERENEEGRKSYFPV